MKKEVLLEIGEELKKNRLSAKISLDQLSKKLKVKKTYLKAIESGNSKILKFDAYTIGYIKHYAAEVGIDPVHYIDQLTNKVTEKKIPQIASKDLITGKEFLPSKKVVFITSILLITIYMLKYFYN